MPPTCPLPSYLLPRVSPTFKIGLAPLCLPICVCVRAGGGGTGTREGLTPWARGVEPMNCLCFPRGLLTPPRPPTRTLKRVWGLMPCPHPHQPHPLTNILPHLTPLLPFSLAVDFGAREGRGWGGLIFLLLVCFFYRRISLYIVYRVKVYVSYCI